MHTAVTLNKLRQRLHVGALQLRDGAPLHGDPNDRMLPLDLLQHARIGRPGARLCLLPLREVELHKEEFAELLRRAERNRVTNGLLGLPLQACNLCSECRAQLTQRGAINGDTSNLHARKHLDQWQLDLSIEAQRSRLAQLFGEGAARRSSHERSKNRLLQRLEPVREIGAESRGGNLHQPRVAHGDIRNPGG